MSEHGHRIDNQQLINKWAASLRRRECAPGTVYVFRSRLQSLATHAARPLGEVTARQIAALIDARQLGASARYSWISTISVFYRWAMVHHPKLVTSDPTITLERPKLRQGLPRPTPDADILAALDVAADPVRTWIVLGAWAGLRCMEMAGLHHEDVLIDEGLLLVRGKGRSERLVPIHDRVLDVLPRGGRVGPMFQQPDGRVYSAHRVSHMINAHFRALGMGWTAHQLRHRFATRVHDASGDLLVTQALLGHASPTTTAIYAKFSSPRAVEAVRKVA